MIHDKTTSMVTKMYAETYSMVTKMYAEIMVAFTEWSMAYSKYFCKW